MIMDHGYYEKNKAEFAKCMEGFLTKTAEFASVKSIDYIIDEKGEEWLYASYRSYSQKRVNVTCDSCYGMLKDFLENINSVDYLLPGDPALIEDFMRDKEIDISEERDAS